MVVYTIFTLVSFGGYNKRLKRRTHCRRNALCACALIIINWIHMCMSETKAAICDTTICLFFLLAWYKYMQLISRSNSQLRTEKKQREKTKKKRRQGCRQLLVRWGEFYIKCVSVFFYQELPLIYTFIYFILISLKLCFECEHDSFPYIRVYF